MKAFAKSPAMQENGDKPLWPTNTALGVWFRVWGWGLVFRPAGHSEYLDLQKQVECCSKSHCSTQF